MFTGIIETVGEIRDLTSRGGDMRVVVGCGELDMSSVNRGDSIAVNGVCLTAVEFTADTFTADVSSETVSCTTLADFAIGSRVNLEMAMLPTTRLGGHLVSGHVDGVGEIKRRWADARSERFRIQAPDALAKYIAAKGSICVDGISLTVNTVEGNAFELNIVPHTLSATTMGEYQTGQKVNLEVDIIARYLERLLSSSADASTAGVSRELLESRGFL
ncbi:MAG: riboflavin synthase [Ectothiorhodospiraceae bacterium]|nr:riboflavin synthase [Ectothiorhodospiraceae bacterium]